MRRLATTAALLAAMFLTATTATAQQKTVGRVGDFDILAIFEKNKFDRCAAHSENGTGALRIAYTKALAYSLSIPGVKGHGPDEMTLVIDGSAPGHYFATGANNDRAWLTLDAETVDALLNASEALDMTFAGRNYSWSFYNSNMTDVFVAIENCVHARM
jgi:hypothetical protein